MSSNVWSVCICLLTAAQFLVAPSLNAQHRSLARITFVTEGEHGGTNDSNPAIWNHADSLRFHIGLYVEAPYAILELTSPTVSLGLASSRTAFSASVSSQSADALSVLDLSLGLSHRYLWPRVAWGVRLGIERWKRGVLRTRSRPHWSVGAIWRTNDLVSFGFTSSKSADLTAVQFAPDRHTLGIMIKHGPRVTGFLDLGHDSIWGVSVDPGIALQLHKSMVFVARWTSKSSSFQSAVVIMTSSVRASMGAAWHRVLGITRGVGLDFGR